MNTERVFANGDKVQVDAKRGEPKVESPGTVVAVIGDPPTHYRVEVFSYSSGNSYVETYPRDRVYPPRPVRDQI